MTLLSQSPTHFLISRSPRIAIHVRPPLAEINGFCWASKHRGFRRKGGWGAVCARCEGRDDGFYMRRAVELARRGMGCTSPNPMVGCVIVKNGEIVGEGFHPKAGQPHAEVFALRDAGDLAEDATAYVSLEPCNHYGRTPPCSEALIRAKVKRVVVGMIDPNPIVASIGVERLRQSGIDVLVGVEEQLCRKLNEAYIHRMVTGKPFVTLRYTLSFGGRILNYLGDGAEGKSGYYSHLLQGCDGIICSANSLIENPPLISNESPSNQSLQIIVVKARASSLRLPVGAINPCNRILLLTEKTISMEPELERMELVVLEKVNLSTILDYCASIGLCNILLDFRGDDKDLNMILEDGLRDSLIQKVVMEVYPVWDTGERTSMAAFPDGKLKLQNLQTSLSKNSVLVEGYLS